jgi:hypothetical protein
MWVVMPFPTSTDRTVDILSLVWPSMETFSAASASESDTDSDQVVAAAGSRRPVSSVGSSIAESGCWENGSSAKAGCAAIRATALKIDWG